MLTDILPPRAFKTYVELRYNLFQVNAALKNHNLAWNQLGTNGVAALASGIEVKIFKRRSRRFIHLSKEYMKIEQ